jgi:hypothetical protein
MTEDLLTRIQQETHERLRELRSAVDEHDRLQAELSTLAAAPEPPPEPEPPATAEDTPEPHVDPEPLAALDIEPEPPANVVRLPARPQLPRTRMVSPKIARLMRAPRRPALERAGVPRVGAGRVERSPADDLWPQETGEEINYFLNA